MKIFYTQDIQFGGGWGETWGVKENSINKTMRTKSPEQKLGIEQMSHYTSFVLDISEN